jgi:hypothetical protein
MAKQARNGKGDSDAAKMLTIRNTPCYLFSTRRRVRMMEATVPGGTPVNFTETRRGKNRHEHLELVKTSFIDLSTKRNLWIKLSDLRDI